MILFWLDLWEIFFLPTAEFEPGTSGSLYLHPTIAPRWLLVSPLTIPLVQRDRWWYCYDWTCERFSFCPQWALYHCAMVTSGFNTDKFRGIGGGVVLIGPVRDFLFSHSGIWTRDLWISSLALKHCATVTSGFTSGNFSYLTEVQRDWWWYCSDWTCEILSFFLTVGFELWISGSLVLHSTTVPWWLLVSPSDNFRYLTVVQRDWWWYCSDWTCERFSFCPQLDLNLGPLYL